LKGRYGGSIASSGRFGKRNQEFFLIKKTASSRREKAVEEIRMAAGSLILPLRLI